MVIAIFDIRKLSPNCMNYTIWITYFTIIVSRGVRSVGGGHKRVRERRESWVQGVESIWFAVRRQTDTFLRN